MLGISVALPAAASLYIPIPTLVCVQYFPVAANVVRKKNCEDLIGCNNGVTERPEANTARASVEVKAEAWIL